MEEKQEITDFIKYCDCGEISQKIFFRKAVDKTVKIKYCCNHHQPLDGYCLLCDKQYSKNGFCLLVSSYQVLEFCSKECSNIYFDFLKENCKSKDFKPTMTCFSCGRMAFLVCNRCKFGRYCSKTCQKKDWAKHKSVCTKNE